MKNKNEKQNSVNNNKGKLLKLNSLDNSSEFLNKFKSISPSKKAIYKSIISSNLLKKNSNRKLSNNFNNNSTYLNHKSSGIYFSRNNNINKLINNTTRNQEIRKNESINEGESPDSKLKRAFTKRADNNLKLNTNLLGDINSRKFYDRKKTFQLIYKSPKKSQKSPYKVFKTNLNDSLSSERDRKIFLYEDTDDIIPQRNDLKIPEEDKIFDELKKYDYFTKKFNKRYRIKTINNNNEEDSKNVKISKSVKVQRNKLSTKKKEQEKFAKTFYDSNGKFMPSQLDKDIFDCLYKTNDDFYTQLNLLKKSKKYKKLKNYQTDLLDYIKDITSIYGYDILKKKLDELHRYNKFKRKTNYKFIKKLEVDEKGIIDDVNKTNKQYLRSRASRGSKKYKFNLPILEFKSVIKEIEENKFKEFLKNRNINKKFSRLSSSQSLKTSKIKKKNEINKTRYSLFRK